MQLTGQIHADDLPAVSRRRVQLAQGLEFPCRGAGLLPQLPDGGLPGVLAVLQLSGGNLPQQLHIGVPELAHQQHPVFIVQGHHAHPARMVHHLPDGLLAVGQQGRIPPDMQDLPVKNFLTG